MGRGISTDKREGRTSLSSSETNIHNGDSHLRSRWHPKTVNSQNGSGSNQSSCQNPQELKDSTMTAEILRGGQRCRNSGDDLRDKRTAAMNQKPAGMTWTLGDVSKATFRDFRHPNSGTWVRVGCTLIHVNDHLTTTLFALNRPSTCIALDTGSFTTQGPHCNTPLDSNHILYQTGTEPSCLLSKNNLVSSD